jgi:hypothetical protein
MKDELKRLKAGALAVMMSFSLTGCASSYGFNYIEGDNRSYVASEDSRVNNTFIKSCYVVEVYNKLRGCNEIYIAREESYVDYKGYNDIFTPHSIIFTNDNVHNNFFEFKKATPLVDYINALGLVQYEYNYEDLGNIYAIIRDIYVFDDNLELTK